MKAILELGPFLPWKVRVLPRVIRSNYKHNTWSNLRTTQAFQRQTCAPVAARSRRKIIFQPIPLRNSNEQMPSIALAATMPLKHDRKRKKGSSIFTLTADTRPRRRKIDGTLQMCAAILPLGSALTLHFVLHDNLPLIAYSAMSLLSFCLYGFDKYRATHHAWRLRENMLHVVDLMGGWPGGYVAQHYFLHKIWKKPFQYVFWITVMLHNLAWIWLYYA